MFQKEYKKAKLEKGIMLQNELEMSKNGKKVIAKYIIIEIIWLVYFSIVAYVEKKVGYITFGELTQATILWRFIQDALILLFPAILVMVWSGKQLDKIGFKKTEIPLCVALLATYVLFFFLRRDYTSIEGCYKFFFYLLLTAFGEEVWSRGFIYMQLKKYNKVVAVIISGVFFGIAHSILPTILQGYSMGDLINSMSSQIGGGVIGGFIFVFYLEFSGSIYVPILVHALIDYSYDIGGLLAAVATALYLLVKRYIKKTNL